MRVAITGAAGFLGNNLCRALLAAGHEVSALVHERGAALDGIVAPGRLRRVEGSILDGPSLESLIGVGPQRAEVLVHLAARISLAPWRRAELHTTNVLGTRNVVEAALEHGTRMIHASSIHALAALPKDKILDEASPPADERQPYYDQSKAEGEREIARGRERGLDAVVVNPTAMIGPNDFAPSQMGQLFLDLHRGKIPAVVAGGFVWVDVRDVATQLVRLVEQRPPSPRYLLPGHHATLLDLAAEVAALAKRAPVRRALPAWLATAMAPFAEGAARLVDREPALSRASVSVLQHHQQVDGSLARRELGFQPRPIGETIADLLADFAARGVLP